VRELEHVIKRSVLVARGPVLTIHELRLDQESGIRPLDAGVLLERLLAGLEAQAALLIDAARRSDPDVAVHELAIDRLERALIHAALAATGNNQVAAARLLGMSRSTLRSKLSN
jgi:DNA-binding NtrC family response regulator